MSVSELSLTANIITCACNNQSQSMLIEIIARAGDFHSVEFATALYEVYSTMHGRIITQERIITCNNPLLGRYGINLSLHRDVIIGKFITVVDRHGDYTIAFCE